MGTSTAKLKLYRPAITGEAVDVQDLNDNMDKLEALLPFTICTSGARPASPFQGQTIFETDTGLVYFWQGAGWRKWIIDIPNMAMTSGMTFNGSLTANGEFEYINPLGNKNAIHNAEFAIAQRGTTGAGSSAATGAGRNGPDRWAPYRAGFVAGLTWSKSAITPPDGFKWYGRCLRDSGNSSTAVINLSQALESEDSYAFRGKKATLSFWARKGANYSAASDVLTASIRSGTATDENAAAAFTGEVVAETSNVTLTTSWQKFTLTTSAVIPTSAAQLKVQFNYTPVGTAGAADNFDITGVQLEIGALDTAFEHVSYSADFAKCLRFYYRHSGLVNDRFGTGVVASGTSAVVWVPFPAIMRASPVFASSGAGHLNVTTGTAFTGSANSSTTLDAYGAQVGVTITGGTGGQGCLGLFNTTAWIEFSAEL